MNELLATALLGSLLGSLHCVGMCGPFVVFYSEAGRAGERVGAAHLAYNGGRLLAYLTLGALAGAAGAALDRAGLWSGLQHAAAWFAAAFMVVYGGVLTRRALRPPRATVGLGAPSPVATRLSRVLLRMRDAAPWRRGLVVGLATGLLPCGWLYGFVALAGGAGSPWLGAAVMGAFWLGTVPALLGAGFGVRAAAAWLGPKLPILMPALVLCLGLVSLTHRGLAAVRASADPLRAAPTCHHE